MRDRGHMRSLVVTVSWALAALASCGGTTPAVSLAPPKQAISHKDYGKMRERWTRHARIIKKLDTTLRVHATLYSPEFFAAFLARRAEMFKLPRREVERLRSEFEQQSSDQYVFFVGAATIDFDWNDFANKRSVWRVSLANDKDKQVAPDGVRSEKIDATLRELYPFLGRFHRAYTFRFPRALPDGSRLVDSTTKELRLRFAGPLGETTLEWRLQ